MCIYILTHHTCKHTSLLLQERCEESLGGAGGISSPGSGETLTASESPPCRFERGRFERWKRGVDERGEGGGSREREGMAKGRREEGEFRERWDEGMCVKCRGEMESGRVLAKKSSFAEIVKNLLNADRELQNQRLSVKSGRGKGGAVRSVATFPRVVVGGKRRVG